MTGRNGTSDSYFNITGNKELVILVEGTLVSADNDRALRVGITTTKSSSKVWLLGNGGKITGAGRNNNLGTLIRVGAYGTLNIGGNLVVEPNTEAIGGASHQGVIDIVAGGTVNLNGGTIRGIADENNASNGTGGAFYNLGTLNINGGVIYGGSVKQGGAIYSKGTLTINGGTVTGGTAINGGSVYVAGGSFTMDNGTITGGTATNSNKVQDSLNGNGGAIYISDGTVTLNGGTVDAGKAVCYIRQYTDSDGKLQKSYHGGRGGTIYVAKGTLSITSGTINGGSAYIGAAIYATSSNAKVEMTNGTINSGTISAQGAVAGIYSQATFDMSGGTIINNVRGESGIRVQDGGKLILRGDAHIKAGAGSRDAVDLVSTNSNRAYLILAGNARISDPDGNRSTANSIYFNWAGTG